MIEYENLGRLNEPFREELLRSFGTLLSKGAFVLGDSLGHFETEFARYCGVTYCSGVANGLDGLSLALRCFGFEEGSEVLVPANTFIATILAIVNCGLRPVLVDPDISTYNVDAQSLEACITSKTVAVMVVHLYGKCCRMDEIEKLARAHNLRLIEDCAHAHGAEFKGRKAGSFGDFGVFSFYPTKNLGAFGDAGAVMTGNEELNIRIRALRNYGSSTKDTHDLIGVNSRLDEMQAAFLSLKLKALDEMNRKRRALARLYATRLSNQFIKPIVENDFHDVYHIYNVRHVRRDALRHYLLENGVDTRIHYPTPPHRQKALANLFGAAQFPVSEEIHATTVSLPISPIHTEKEIAQVIDLMNAFR